MHGSGGTSGAVSGLNIEPGMDCCPAGESGVGSGLCPLRSRPGLQAEVFHPLFRAAPYLVGDVTAVEMF